MPETEPLRGSSSDPEFRRARARLAVAASNSLDSRIRSIVRRAGELTPEQIETLRSLLPEPTGGDDHAA